MLNRAVSLLRRAAELHDRGGLAIRHPSQLWRADFAMGAAYMAAVLSKVRARPISSPPISGFNRLGYAKYGTVVVLTLVWALAALFIREAWLVFFSPLVFYVTEVQMVFAFPLALEGSPHPFRDSRTLVIQEGGTLKALPLVLLFAGTMLIGGLLGRGFVRSWCIGCLAVVLWYVEARYGVQEESHDGYSGNWVHQVAPHPARTVHDSAGDYGPL